MPFETVTAIIYIFSNNGPFECTYQYAGSFILSDYVTLLRAELKKHHENADSWAFEALVPQISYSNTDESVTVVNINESPDNIMNVSRPPASLYIHPIPKSDMNQWYEAYEAGFKARVEARVQAKLPHKFTKNQRRQAEEQAVEDECRDDLRKRAPKTVRILPQGAWVLFPKSKTDDVGEEKDILVVHPSACLYPPIEKPPNALFNGDGVKNQYYMAPASTILLHLEVKAPLSKTTISKSNSQLSTTIDSGFRGSLVLTEGDTNWFRSGGDPLRITITTIGILTDSNPKCEGQILRKLLTTEDFKKTDAVAIIGWGFFIRYPSKESKGSEGSSELNKSRFIAVPGCGLALCLLDKAITERHSQWGAQSHITNYL